MKKCLLLVCCMIAFLFTSELVIAQGNFFNQTATIQGPDETISSLVVSPDGLTIAYSSYADTFIHVVDIATQHEILTLRGHTDVVTSMAFSPDGQLLASAGTVFLDSPVDGTVRVWDVASGAQFAFAETAPAGIDQLAFSPDGSMLAGASGGASLNVFLWEPTSMNLIRAIPDVFRLVAFSPDGSKVATAKRDDKLYFIDAATGEEISSFDGHIGWIHSAAYSSSGQLIATGGEDRIILVRNAESGATVRTLIGHESFPEYLIFSPDATMLASLGSGMNIYRSSGGGITFTLGDADKFLRLWDMSTGNELSALNIESDVLSGVSFSANWNVLVTGSTTGLIRIFHWTDQTGLKGDQVSRIFELLQNYPNPFSLETEIGFSVPVFSHVTISIYNMQGYEVCRLIDAQYPAGSHSIRWDAKDSHGQALPSGIYLYQLKAGNFYEMRKMSVIR